MRASGPAKVDRHPEPNPRDHDGDVLLRGVVMLLEPTYEGNFYGFSCGFRPGRSAHDAYVLPREGLWEMLFLQGVCAVAATRLAKRCA